ncbi:glycosyltransferase involved in cell wall biosynthesis [Bradyrhizobium sp. F1.13.4]
MAKFDVVVPCYNYGRFLTDCVRSVLDQSVADVRILIIDDASSDSSVEIARGLADTDSRVRVVAHASNKGHIATYNEGIDWANGDYFLLLSADDLLAPGALERAAKIMDSCPEVGLTFGECLVWRRDTPRPFVNFVQDLRWTKQDLVAEMCRTASDFVATATAIARTTVQKAVGGYRPSLPHSGDLEMWLRFGAHAEVAKIEAVQAIYRKHDSAMSNAYLAEMLAEYGQRKAAFDSFFETCRDRRPDISLLQRQVAHLARRSGLRHRDQLYPTGAHRKRLDASALGHEPRLANALPSTGLAASADAWAGGTPKTPVLDGQVEGATAKGVAEVSRHSRFTRGQGAPEIGYD